MIRAAIRKRAVASAVVLCASMLVLPAALSNQALARDHVRLHKPHISHSELRPFDPQAAASFSAYAGTYDPIPHNPLIPLRPEVPPPVDPNEPTSGSYGASIAGYNAGGSTP